MYHNGLRYGRIAALVLFTHIVMLLAVLFRGNYETIQDLAPLTIAVLGLDVVYIITLRFFYKQMTYTTDFLLLLILNISVIFQSCFGGIGFAAKHYITCIMALICCQIMFLLTRNHIRLMAIKKYLYIVLGVIMLAILLLTGSRSMWIQIGPISLQPSEFMKPVFVLLCATSIMEQHEKTKVLFFYVSKEALLGNRLIPRHLCAAMVVLLGLGQFANLCRSLWLCSHLPDLLPKGKILENDLDFPVCSWRAGRHCRCEICTGLCTRPSFCGHLE